MSPARPVMLLHVASTGDVERSYLHAEGEIDLATADTVRTAVLQAIQSGVRHVTLDLDHVRYIDSSGLGTLIGAHKRLSALGGSLVVRCRNERVLRLFSITGIDKVLTLVVGDDAEAAPA